MNLVARRYWRRFACGVGGLTLGSALVLVLAAGSAEARIYRVFDVLNGSGSLPVYRVSGAYSAHYWVHRNAVHLINRSADFNRIRQRISKRLSTACALGRFNQRVNQKYFVIARIKRSKNLEVLGFAHGRGVNLYDPDDLADRRTGYFFRYDRSGQCTVYRT